MPLLKTEVSRPLFAATFEANSTKAGTDNFLTTFSLEAYGCCWNGGSHIKDYWMWDLERYGLAKSFRVYIGWNLSPVEEPENDDFEFPWVLPP